MVRIECLLQANCSDYTYVFVQIDGDYVLRSKGDSDFDWRFEDRHLDWDAPGGYYTLQSHADDGCSIHQLLWVAQIMGQLSSKPITVGTYFNPLNEENRDYLVVETGDFSLVPDRIRIKRMDGCHRRNVFRYKYRWDESGLVHGEQVVFEVEQDRLDYETWVGPLRQLDERLYEIERQIEEELLHTEHYWKAEDYWKAYRAVLDDETHDLHPLVLETKRLKTEKRRLLGEVDGD